MRRKPILALRLFLVMLTTQVALGCASSKPNKSADDDPKASFKSDLQAEAVNPANAELDPELMRLAHPGKPTDPTSTHSSNPVPAKSTAAAETKKTGDGEKDRTEALAGKSDQNEVIKYVVKPNDTLMKISFEFLGDVYRWKEIYRDNKAKIRNFNALVKGTVLDIHRTNWVSIDKNGIPYLIKPRDTLWRISDNVYGTSKDWPRLWHNNRQLIHDPNQIYSGFYLYYLMTEGDRRNLEKFRLLKDPTPVVVPPLAGTTPDTSEKSARAPASEPDLVHKD